MSTNLFLQRKISLIPLWHPSPSTSTEPHALSRHIDIGNVGYFDDQGRFNTLFNIFQTVGLNMALWKYNPPEGFIPMNPAIKPETSRVDVDFDHELMYTSGFETQQG